MTAAVVEQNERQLVFVKLPKILLNNKDKKLTDTESKVLTQLYNRREWFKKLAIQNNKQPLEYVVYSRKNMSTDIGVCQKTVTRATQGLITKGAIIADTTSGRATRYYINDEFLTGDIQSVTRDTRDMTRDIEKVTGDTRDIKEVTRDITGDISIADQGQNVPTLGTKCPPNKNIYIYNNTSSISSRSSSNSNTDTVTTNNNQETLETLKNIEKLLVSIDSRLTAVERKQEKAVVERETVIEVPVPEKEKETDNRQLSNLEQYFDDNNMTLDDIDMFDVVINTFCNACKNYLNKPYRLNDSQKIKLYNAYNKIDSDDFNGLYFITTAVKNARKSRIFRNNGLDFLLKNMDKAYNDEWMDRDWVADKVDVLDQYYQDVINDQPTETMENQATEEENHSNESNDNSIISSNQPNDRDMAYSNQGHNQTPEDDYQQPNQGQYRIYEPKHQDGGTTFKEFQSNQEVDTPSQEDDMYGYGNQRDNAESLYADDALCDWMDDRAFGSTTGSDYEYEAEVGGIASVKEPELTLRQKELIARYPDTRSVMSGYLNHELQANDYQWLNSYYQDIRQKNRTLSDDMSIAEALPF